MEKYELDSWVKQIQVTNQPDGDVEVVNNSPLPMMGKGRQGAVFRISDDKCMKVFGNQEDCNREHYALSLGKHTDLFPRVYKKGDSYIVLEYVTGVDLREYLQSQPLTPELSFKLVQMLSVFKEIGLERIDHHKRQIYVQPNGELKVIDVGRTVWRNRVYPYPRKLLNSLGDKHRSVFLSHVKSVAPELYQEWQYYMQMERMAHEIYQRLLANPSDVNLSKIKELSRSLRTLDDSQIPTKHIEGLFYKVFKEEWENRVIQKETRDHDKSLTKQNKKREEFQLRKQRDQRFDENGDKKSEPSNHYQPKNNAKCHGSTHRNVSPVQDKQSSCHYLPGYPTIKLLPQ